MLPKKERFSSEAISQKNIFINNKKIYTEYGFFVVLKENIGVVKFGIVIGKKNFKTAVLRNKYKRLFYNSLLEIKKENKDLLNKSLIFHPKKSFTKEQLIADLKKQVFLV